MHSFPMGFLFMFFINSPNIPPLINSIFSVHISILVAAVSLSHSLLFEYISC